MPNPDYIPQRDVLHQGVRQSIRARCLECVGFEVSRIEPCPFAPKTEQSCPLYPLRQRGLKRQGLKVKKQIRAYCLWCMQGQETEVKLCPSTKCPLWYYRFGRTRATHSASPKCTEALNRWRESKKANSQ